MYEVVDARTVKRLSDGAFVPLDPANRDGAAYLAWAKQGNVASPAQAVIQAEPPNFIAEIEELKARLAAVESKEAIAVR